MEKTELLKEVLEKVKADGKVASHFGPDLDQKATVEALRLAVGAEKLEVSFVPAGTAHESLVTVDSGNANGIERRGDTFVVDSHGGTEYKNTLEILKDYGYEEVTGIKIPEQLIEYADTLPQNIPFSDYKTGLSLSRSASGEQIWKLAEAGLLDKELNQEQLKEFGLEEIAKKQKEIVINAFTEVNKGRVGNWVIVDKFVQGGAFAAYERGADFYASVQDHTSGSGVTFAVTARPGVTIPEEVKETLREIGGDAVFFAPNGQMAVLGGPKNPDVKADITKEEFKKRLFPHIVKEKAKEKDEGLEL